MAGNYDSMVFGPGNGDSVSAEKSGWCCIPHVSVCLSVNCPGPLPCPCSLGARALSRRRASSGIHETPWNQ